MKSYCLGLLAVALLYGRCTLLDAPAAAVRIEHPFFDAEFFRFLRQRARGGQISQFLFQLASSRQTLLFR